MNTQPGELDQKIKLEEEQFRQMFIYMGREDLWGKWLKYQADARRQREEERMLKHITGHPVMTRLFRALLAAVCVFALFFFSVAFVAWESNPQLWSQDARFVFVTCAIPFSLMAAIFASGDFV
jgi:hypothetical protein